MAVQNSNTAALRPITLTSCDGMHRRARFEEESASASVEERLRLSGALPCGASAAADRRGSARRRKERIVATLVSLMESKDPEAQWNLGTNTHRIAVIGIFFVGGFCEALGKVL